VRNWSQAEASLKRWSGAWLAIYVGHLARSNKTQVRSTERALKLYGLAQAKPGLWVRPDNLKVQLGEIRASLLALGLARMSIAAHISHFEPDGSIVPSELWNRSELECRYGKHIRELAASGRRLAHLDDQKAAGEALLIGRRVTRDILLDPLLPDELIDGDLRRCMVAAMRDYDKTGKSLWRRFFAAHQQRNAQKPAA
ncbi:MAG: hypothetical protein ACC642_05655, partial [Pseudomonadales bacterium]